jgi:hypothetical protein
MYQTELITVAMIEFVEEKQILEKWMEFAWLPDGLHSVHIHFLSE